MSKVDHSLVYQACKAINGANTHAVNACLIGYEKATNAKTRARFERRLRQFVACSNRCAALRAKAEFLRGSSQLLIERGKVLSQRIDLLKVQIPNP